MWPQCQNNACLLLACISFCHKFHFFVSEINRLLWNFLQYFLHLCYECSCPAASISLTSTHFSIFFFIMSCIYNRSPLLRISWQAFLRQFWHRFPTWQKTTTSPIRSWISKVSNFGLKSCDGISSFSNVAKSPIYVVLDIYETSSLVFLCQKAFKLMWKRLAKCRNSVMPFLSYCHFLYWIILFSVAVLHNSYEIFNVHGINWKWIWKAGIMLFIGWLKGTNNV